MKCSLLRDPNRVALCALLAVLTGLALMMGYFVSRHGAASPHGRVLFGAASYATLADGMLAHGFSGSNGGEPLGRMPLYIGLVLLAKVLGGNAWSYVLIALQGAMALATGVMIQRIAARLSESSWVPAAITVAYTAHLGLQIEHFALRETGLYEFIIAGFFYFATHRPAAASQFFGMVAAAVLAYYTRPTGVLLLIPLALCALLLPARSMGSRLQRLAWTVGAVVLCAAPWQVYQSYARGQFTLDATDVGGLNLYKGNSYAYESVSPYVDQDDAPGFIDKITAAYEQTHTAPEQVTDWAEDNYLRQLAKADIHADYFRYLRKAILRIESYLSPLETPLGSARVDMAGARVVLNDYRGNFVDADAGWLPFLGQLSFFVVLFAVPLGALGLIRGVTIPAQRPVALATLCFLLANVAAHAALTAETRYRLYLDPLFLAWSALALGAIFAAPSGRVPCDAVPDAPTQLG